MSRVKLVRSGAIKYRKGYKYQLAEDFTIQLSFKPNSDLDIIEEFYTFGIDGLLTIRAGYAWDGCSGPTYDRKSNMTAGLVHDCLYQMMREERIAPSKKADADKIFRRLCSEDGMFAPIVWLYYQGVDDFGKSSTLPENNKPILTAP